MEEPEHLDQEWDSLSDVDLYTDTPEASTSESTRVPGVSKNSPPKINTGGSSTTSPEVSICQQHNKKLQYFCKTDQLTICVLCLAENHEGHDTVLSESHPSCSENPAQMERMAPKCSLRKGREELVTPDCYRSPFQIQPFVKRRLTVKHRLIEKGCPDCYLLSTERTNIDGFEDIRRWTFGERGSNNAVKNILVVGETGTGKTTVINTMVNYLLGVQWGDNVWFQITEEDKKKSQAKSQTTAITVYEVFVESSSLSLRIIDTPGYGSTDGIEFDKMVAENLHELFRSENGVHDINAVGLVVKSGQNRLTDFQRYIFDAVLSLFGKDIEKNIVVLITHSDGMSEEDVMTALKEAEVPCAKDAYGEPVNFQFNNRQSKGYKEREEKMYQQAWDLGYYSLERFLSFLHDVDVKELSMTEGVLRERKKLEACVYNIQDAIKMEELKQNELQQTQRALEENKEKFGKNEDFTYEVEEPFKQLESINPSWWHFRSKKATCCTKCEENCHYPGCWWVKDLSWCSVMKDNRCTVCTRKCPVSDHVKHEKIYVPRTRKVKKIYHDLKKKYEAQVDIRKALEEELHESKVKKETLLLEAYQCIVKLEEIALKKDSMSTLIHLDFLIEKMKELGDHEKAQKLVDLNKTYQDANKSKWTRWVPERLRKVQEKMSSYMTG